MKVPQRYKEAHKSSYILPFSLPVTILDTQNNTEDRYSMYRTVGIKRIVIHQHQNPGQNLGAGKPPSKITEDGMTVDIAWEIKESSRKYTEIFLMGGGG